MRSLLPAHLRRKDMCLSIWSIIAATAYRWLIGEGDYTKPVEKLEAAERNGKLTSHGEKTLSALREIEKDSKGRLGELSDKGAIQHKGIGWRMALNFPEIFNDSADIDAKSTVVIRCILSMLNGLEGSGRLRGCFAQDRCELCRHVVYELRRQAGWAVKDKAMATVLKEYQEKHKGDGSYLSRLVTDAEFAADSVAPG